MGPRANTKKIIVHCSDTDEGTMAAIRNYHIKVKGWEDIGYHFVIDLDGTVEPGRLENLIGAHCKDDNDDSIGICLIGKTYNEFTEKQFDSLKALLKQLLAKYNLTYEAIFGHYEMPSGKAQGKTCPVVNANLLRVLLKGDPDEVP